MTRNTNALRPMPAHSIGMPRYRPMRGLYETLCSCGASIVAPSRIEATAKADAHHALNRKP